MFKKQKYIPTMPSNQDEWTKVTLLCILVCCLTSDRMSSLPLSFFFYHTCFLFCHSLPQVAMYACWCTARIIYRGKWGKRTEMLLMSCEFSENKEISALSCRRIVLVSILAGEFHTASHYNLPQCQYLGRFSHWLFSFYFFNNTWNCGLLWKTKINSLIAHF